MAIAAATELERLVVRLVGDDSDYQRTLRGAVNDTRKAATDIETATKKATTAQSTAMQDAARITKQAQRPLEQYRSEVRKLDGHWRAGRITGETYRRTLDRINKEFGQGQAKIAAYGRSIKQAGQSMMMYGTGLSFGVTLPIVGVGVAATKASSDAEETRNKFNVVFRDIRDQASATAAELDRAYGMSSEGAEKLLSNTGDLLTGFGFSQEAALELSTQVQTLAVDLASFTNIEGGTERASRALTSALLGEAEAAKSLGIVIRQDEPAYKNMLKHFMDVEGLSQTQAKAMVALTMATEQSKNATGDFHRSQASLANQTRELAADIKDMAVAYGNHLMPAAKGLVRWLRAGVGWMRDLEPATKKVVITVAALAAAIGPLVFSLGMATTAVGLLTMAWGHLSIAQVTAVKTFIVAAAPYVAAATAIAGAVWLIADAWHDADLGMHKMLRSVRVNGTSLGAWIDAWANQAVQIFDWVVKQARLAWLDWKVAVWDVTEEVYRFIVVFAGRVERVFWQVASNSAATMRRLVAKTTSMLVGSHLMSIDKALELNKAANKMQADIDSRQGRNDAAREQRIKNSLDRQLHRYQEYASDVKAINDEASEQARMMQDALTGIFLADNAPGSRKPRQLPTFQLPTIPEFSGGVLPDEVKPLKPLEKELTEFEQRWANAWESMGDSVAQGFEDALLDAKSVKDAIGGIIDEISRAAVRAAITQPLSNMASGFLQNLFGGLGAAFGGGFTGGSTPLPASLGTGAYVMSAHGNAFNRPIAFPLGGGRTGVAGEAGPEAILPLERDEAGNLGVAGGGNITVNQHITTPDADSFRRSAKQTMRAARLAVGRT